MYRNCSIKCKTLCKKQTNSDKQLSNSHDPKINLISFCLRHFTKPNKVGIHENDDIEIEERADNAFAVGSCHQAPETCDQGLRLRDQDPRTSDQGQKTSYSDQPLRTSDQKDSDKVLRTNNQDQRNGDQDLITSDQAKDTSDQVPRTSDKALRSSGQALATRDKEADYDNTKLEGTDNHEIRKGSLPGTVM